MLENHIIKSVSFVDIFSLQSFGEKKNQPYSDLLEDKTFREKKKNLALTNNI